MAKMPMITAPTGADTILVPRSATPAKQRFYDWLLDHGWRYVHQTCEWFTPEGEEPERRGRFCWTPDLSEAWLQPPSSPAAIKAIGAAIDAGDMAAVMDASRVPPAILRLSVADDGETVLSWRPRRD